MYTWTFERVPNGSVTGCQHCYPVGFNWHPLEGAGMGFHVTHVYKAIYGGLITPFIPWFCAHFAWLAFTPAFLYGRWAKDSVPQARLLLMHA